MFFLGGGSLPLGGYGLGPAALRAYAATPSRRDAMVTRSPQRVLKRHAAKRRTS